MTEEIKTLKDIEEEHMEIPPVQNLFKNVKEEAIKWVKEDLKLLGNATFKPIERLRIICERQIKRFNIIEEDLK